jgi:Flp pilus assembly protein TadG
MLVRRDRRLGRQASASVEFALMATLFLLPLLLGGMDFVVIISARAQLNLTLQAMFYFAETDPTVANNSPNVPGASAPISTAAISELVTTINSNSIYRATITSATAEYGCVYSDAVNFQGTSSSCPSKDAANQSLSQQDTAVSYAISTTFSIPIPLHFGWTNPVTLTASGQVLD